jgi:hypothetical protein
MQFKFMLPLTAAGLAMLASACSDVGGRPRTTAERNEITDRFLRNDAMNTGQMPAAGTDQFP